MKSIISIFALGALLLTPTLVSAQVNIGDYGDTFGLGTADLEATVINIVQWVLGFLGLIAVIIILYGGFVWMTAGGNEERISTAKKVISAAVVGLIIVLLAWAIVTFVVKTTLDVTGAEPE